MRPTLRSAVGSDVGRRRENNQDSAVTSPRILAVADGMGGHAHGEVASAVAISALLDLDARLRGADLAGVDLLDALRETIDDAAARLTGLAQQDPDLRGTGTTVVALLVDGTRIGALHLGDSRAYLLRDGQLHRLTRDHTLVQSLVDEGRISEAEAATHPRRSWLVKTLQDSSIPEPDLFHVEGRPDDRYLICSDGATAVLEDAQLHEILAGFAEPAAAVAELIARANAGGGPDNITCIVADLVEGAEPEDDIPVVVGSAAALS
ncbi:protein phosphatase 2C domain-containing protein [Pseudonocardia sp. DSM 110487]|uniref:PP2C family protein-serine/threonine phosphatase n=1 Tax=Pseudonocardia sp. DSM 110487 TaxID=2865833 RepID=UPI001C694477|nr:protein phosphatase 2C domain-containing protein [Pseudonocardia sp. DSM 110487]QYN37286.1 protein phosphatase 2C domain-containing protein [Pseudonocardia sp. DSM 110487]